MDTVQPLFPNQYPDTREPMSSQLSSDQDVRSASDTHMSTRIAIRNDHANNDEEVDWAWQRRFEELEIKLRKILWETCSQS